MNGYAKHYRSGVQTQTTFYNGAYWHTHQATTRAGWRWNRWYSVQRIGQRYPRVYGVAMLEVRNGRFGATS